MGKCCKAEGKVPERRADPLGKLDGWKSAASPLPMPVAPFGERRLPGHQGAAKWPCPFLSTEPECEIRLGHAGRDRKAQSVGRRWRGLRGHGTVERPVIGPATEDCTLAAGAEGKHEIVPARVADDLMRDAMAARHKGLAKECNPATGIMARDEQMDRAAEGVIVLQPIVLVSMA